MKPSGQLQRTIGVNVFRPAMVTTSLYFSIYSQTRVISHVSCYLRKRSTYTAPLTKHLYDMSLFLHPLRNRDDLSRHQPADERTRFPSDAVTRPTYLFPALKSMIFKTCRLALTTVHQCTTACRGHSPLLDMSPVSGETVL